MSRQDYPTGNVVVAATIPDHVRIIEHLRYLDKKCPDFAQISIEPPKSFQFDERLFKGN